MITNFELQHSIVTGASSQIGHFLIPHLKVIGTHITAVSRQVRTCDEDIAWQYIDLTTTNMDEIPATTLFHIAPLSLIPTIISSQPQLKRIIAFSSTSRFTKLHSPIKKERDIANELARAENKMIELCEKKLIAWTLFRPTLIYGAGKDKNITFIMDFIQRYGFFPIFGEGRGLRQPVHAEDLAIACTQVWHNENTYNKAYDLSGGETLTYQEMVSHIFEKMHKRPRIISIPLPVFKTMINSINWIPRFKHLSSEMATRMNQDLCFDHTLACQDFDYHPRKFRPFLESQTIFHLK